MEALFTNPLTLIVGTALVSAPIIIHLINRMRFRRIKWAAMEFLLKAQKRMRRKLIIEQLILLFLRCLLVFLVGLLLARFKWFSPLEGQDTRATAHVVVLDDSPSMADFFAADGRQSDAFDQAKVQITDKVAPAAAQANTPQSMDVVLMSDLANPRAFERLNETAIGDMRSYLAPLRPSAVRVSLVAGLRRAKEVLDRKAETDMAKVIHVVTDLRAVDWLEDGETLRQLFTELTNSGVRVHIIDVAYPDRKDTDRQPRSSDNVGIVEFRPRTRVVARARPVDFELRVKNFGATHLKDVKVHFFLHGRGNLIPTVSLPELPSNQEVTTVVTVPQFDRVGTKDNPLDRFNLVTAVLALPETGGLKEDNVRHAVVEVQEQLSVLVVEGTRKSPEDKTGDAFYLRRLFQDAFGGIRWVDGSVQQLESQDLKQYAAIYLLNVPAVTADQAKKLEAYVRGGGGLGVFLGPDVRPKEYNEHLYNKGAGLFPVPLPPEPTKPPDDEARLKRTLVLSKRVLARDPGVKAHPAVVGLYTGTRGASGREVDIERLFLFPNIDQYWPVQRIGDWQRNQSVRELYCLPNQQSVADFEGAVDKLIRSLRERAGEPKFEKYRVHLDPLQEKIRHTAASPSDPLTALVLHLDRLLCDQINEGDPSEPVLREFWAHPEVTDLRAEFQRLRDSAKFGDPLYLVKDFGQGRVAAMMTTAGTQWTDWPAGQGSPGWVMLMTELQRYLSGGGSEENRSVGTPVTATYEDKRYKPTVARAFLTANPFQPDRSGDIPVTLTAKGEQPLEASGGALNFRFDEAKQPGAYLFTFTQLTGANADVERPEYVPYTFNLDAQREGDLRRANREDLAVQAPGVAVHSPDDSAWTSALKQKTDDLSTRRWLYLLILLVLIAEQAMAVRLSYHTRPEDLELHAPSAAAAFAHGAAPAPTVAADGQVAPPAETAGV